MSRARSQDLPLVSQRPPRRYDKHDWRGTIPDIEGRLQGLAQTDLTAAHALLTSRVKSDEVISAELAAAMCRLSFQIRRPVGVLLTRRGMVQQVIIGTDMVSSLSTLAQYRT